MADDQNLEATTPEGGEEAVRPEWLPENFKTPEALASSYKELQREFHSTRSELKAQRETMEQFILEQQAEAPPEQNTDQVYAAFESDPVGTMAWLATQAAENAVSKLQPELAKREKPLLQAQNELLAYTVDQMVTQRIPDWADQKSAVVDYIKDRPWLFPQEATVSPATAAEALQSAYKAYRYDDLSNQTQSQAEALKAANELAKRQAQTLQGSPGSPAATDADNDYWESVKSVKTNRYGG